MLNTLLTALTGDDDDDIEVGRISVKLLPSAAVYALIAYPYSTTFDS